MEAPGKSASRFYRPELDVVRLIVFLLVFASHTIPVQTPHGAAVLGRLYPFVAAGVSSFGFGLSLFFTLSAFLICELLIRERESSGRIHAKQFYIRRVLRIWPLYYLALAIGLVLAFLPGGNHGDAVYVGWFSIFMGAWYCIVHGRAPNGFMSLWSISVEEQFYLFAPWVVKYFRRRAIYGFCLVLVAVSNVCLFVLGKMRVSNDAVWFNSLVQFECFAAGILLCLVLHGGLPRFKGWQRLLPLAGCCICWFLACYSSHSEFQGSSVNPGSWPLIFGYALASLGSVLMLVAFLGIRAKFLPGWAVYLGRISFGLYVYHEFGLSLAQLLPLHTQHVFDRSYMVQTLAGLLLTIAMAAISYRFFETPFLKLKKRFTFVQSHPV